MANSKRMAARAMARMLGISEPKPPKQQNLSVRKLVALLKKEKTHVFKKGDVVTQRPRDEMLESYRYPVPGTPAVVMEVFDTPQVDPTSDIYRISTMVIGIKVVGEPYLIPFRVNGNSFVPYEGPDEYEIPTDKAEEEEDDEGGPTMLMRPPTLAQ